MAPYYATPYPLHLQWPIWNTDGALREAFVHTHTVVSPDVAANVQLQFVANLNRMLNRAALTGIWQQLFRLGCKVLPWKQINSLLTLYLITTHKPTHTTHTHTKT